MPGGTKSFRVSPCSALDAGEGVASWIPQALSPSLLGLPDKTDLVCAKRQSCAVSQWYGDAHTDGESHPCP